MKCLLSALYSLIHDFKLVVICFQFAFNVHNCECSHICYLCPMVFFLVNCFPLANLFIYDCFIKPILYFSDTDFSHEETQGNMDLLLTLIYAFINKFQYFALFTQRCTEYLFIFVEYHDSQILSVEVTQESLCSVTYKCSIG